MRRECRERFPRHRLQRKPLVSDPGMHHGMCVTHVPWCMSGSLTRSGGENVPGIPGACATCNVTYLVRGPLEAISKFISTRSWIHVSRSTIHIVNCMKMNHNFHGESIWNSYFVYFDVTTHTKIVAPTICLGDCMCYIGYEDVDRTSLKSSEQMALFWFTCSPLVSHGSLFDYVILAPFIRAWLAAFDVFYLYCRNI